MRINLKLTKALFLPKLYPMLFDYSHRIECYYGGAGAGKSYFVCQKLIVRACTENIRILVCRRYGTTLRQTVFALFKEVLQKWKLVQYVKINESDYRIVFPNGSEIIFTGLDEETKLLSLTNIGTIWVEEAYEISQSMYEQLNLRMRGNNEHQQIIMTWNPINKSSWLYAFINNLPVNSTYIHTTYNDNPHLSPEYIASIEELQTRNPQKWRVYGLGEWGVNADGLVFKNWDVQPLDTINLAKIYEHRVGMDFGYNDPSAIVDTYYDANNHVIYITNEFYKTGQQLSDLRAVIDNMHLKCKIQCDAAEPRTIDYFRKQGINAVPCIKGQNSVNARLLFLQDNKLIVSPSCTNVINELENFSYKFDRQSNSYTDDTTHEYSHSIDALGYAYSDIYTKSKLHTLDKGVLGL